MPDAFAMSSLRPPAVAPLRSQQVRIGSRSLPGDLDIPAQSRALVLFAHGSGSSRLSSRNRWVAEVLQQHQLSTLLFDLLDDDEAADRRKVFDIGLLSQRIDQALDWAAGQAALELEALYQLVCRVLIDQRSDSFVPCWPLRQAGTAHTEIRFHAC